MPADYAEVLKDLDASIASLEAEIATLRAGRPTIVMLRNRYSPIQFSAPVSPDGAYAHLGPTGAIPLVLKSERLQGNVALLTTNEIADKLRAGGVRTKGQDFTGNVSATLSRLRDQNIVEKVGDGWRLKQAAQIDDDDRDIDHEYESARDAVMFAEAERR